MQAKQAYISGSLGVALYLNERDQTMILDLKTPEIPREPRRNEVNFFFNVALHYRAQNPDLRPVSLDILREDLRVENLNFMAFDHMHIGMDRHMLTGLREKAICKANMLMRENAHVNTYVKHHFLFPLNSQEWDVKGAGELAEKLSKPFALKYYTLFNSYTIDNVYESAILIAKEQFKSVFEQNQIMDDFFHSGLFGDFVEAVGDKNSAFINQVIFNAKSYHGFDNQAGKKFVTSLMNKHKPETKTSAPILEVAKPTQDPLLTLVETFLEKDNMPVKKRGNKPRNEVKNPNTRKFFEAVISQIENIEIIINNNKILEAKNLTNQLIKQQLENSDREQVTKTLTQIAYFALNVNVTNFVEIIIKAIDLLGAGDAVSDTVKAQYLIQMGRLDEALKLLFDTMHRFPQNEVVCVVYADLLRQMGQKDKALGVLEEIMHRFPTDVIARNAYAELLREMGQKDKALGVLEETMNHFPQNEVARSAKAHLLIELNRFDEAKKLLSIYTTSPRSKNDWIGFHILAMAELKQKNYTVAFEKFDYGIKNCTIESSKVYFENAYVLSSIRAKEFENAKEAIKIAMVAAKLQEQITLKLLDIQNDIGLKTLGFNPKIAGLDIAQHGDAAQKLLLKLLIERHGLISEKKPLDINKYQANENKIIKLQDDLVFGSIIRDLNKSSQKSYYNAY